MVQIEPQPQTEDDPAARDALVADVTAAPMPYTDDAGVIIPIESQSVVALC